MYTVPEVMTQLIRLNLIWWTSKSIFHYLLHASFNLSNGIQSESHLWVEINGTNVDFFRTQTGLKEENYETCYNMEMIKDNLQEKFAVLFFDRSHFIASSFPLHSRTLLSHQEKFLFKPKTLYQFRCHEICKV